MKRRPCLFDAARSVDVVSFNPMDSNRDRCPHAAPGARLPAVRMEPPEDPSSVQ